MDKISVIVPCFNEQEALPLFYEKTINILKEMEWNYEFIFIDDGSSDLTLKTIKEFAQKDGRIMYISFSRNFGKEAAMYAGLCNAQGKYAVVMDADMQDPPELLPEMMKLMQDGEYDSIAARRGDRIGEPPIRSWFAKKFYKIINRISDADIVDGARDFRLMNRKMIDAVISIGEYNRFSKGIFGWIGFRTYWLEFENAERVAGKTKWRFWDLLRYAVGGIIDFSQVPLSIASWFGITMTLLAFIMLAIIIIRKLTLGDPVAGWASLVCVILFIGGIQLFCIGIIGQYLAKTYLETKKRPHYIVAESNLKKD